MNKKELIKNEYETESALILLRYLNNKGYDYVIDKKPPTPTTWGDVDVFAKSTSGKHSSLYIQVTKSMPPKNLGGSGFQKVMDSVYTFENYGLPDKAIMGKAEKYIEKGRDFSQITLIVREDILRDDDKIYNVPALQNKCKQYLHDKPEQYKFKAIYLLSGETQLWGTSDEPIEEIPEIIFQIA